jgi:tol-pal system protein YbgF
MRMLVAGAAFAALCAVGAPAHAQDSDSEVYLRIERLENQLRQMTGAIEQLEHRNRQLEQQLKRFQDEIEYRFQHQGAPPAGKPQTSAAPPPPPPPPSAPPAPAATQGPPPAAPPARRSDAFDPSANPNAPGAPRGLGGGARVVPSDEPDVGAPGGRAPSEPLDLANQPVRGAAPPPRAPETSPLPAPPPRNTAATGAQPTAPPTQSPKDVFDLGYGYLLRKDYALAEQTLQSFLQSYPADTLAADATYWIGETRFQRQRYRDAAESFLAVTTKYEAAAKAPEALLRLGQSLAALKEKEAACAALGEAVRKHPAASNAVKQGVAREQKRLGC